MAPENRRISTETPSPERVAEDCRLHTLGPVSGCIEVSSQSWRDSQHLKVARAHALTFKSLRLAWSRDRWLPGSQHSESIERTTPLRNLSIGAEGYVLTCTVGAVVPNHRQLTSMWIW